MITIVIDPGHGGPSGPPKGGSSWNNATGPTGLLEKDATLLVAKAVESAFEGRPVRVVLTRSSDVNLSLEKRASIAADANAEVFVSLHFNAPEPSGPPAQGTETWINSSTNAQSRELARAVQDAVVAATGYRDRGIKVANGLGVLREDYHAAETARCLCELSFLTRQPEEEARLRTAAYIARLGRAVRDGILDYCAAANLLTETTAARSGDVVDLEDAISYSAIGRAGSGRATTVPDSRGSDADRRMAMAREIVDLEARRKGGKLIVYEPPESDGGGAFEVAGINVRYHPEMAEKLKELIESGQPDEAEALAAAYIAQYTDAVAGWCTRPGVEFFLRDSAFNRGLGGAAHILQIALDLPADGIVGPITKAAVAAGEKTTPSLLQSLRAAREEYERTVKKVRPIFIRGLINRWNKALAIAQKFEGSSETAGAAVVAAKASRRRTGASSALPTFTDRILNCLPSPNVNEDWSTQNAIEARLVGRGGLPPSVDLRRDWWEIGDQGRTGSCVGWATADSVLRWSFVKAKRIREDERLSVRFA